MKHLTIDFTEGVTLQPFNIMTQAIESQKQMIMWFAENLGVLNEKRCKIDEIDSFQKSMAWENQKERIGHFSAENISFKT